MTILKLKSGVRLNDLSAQMNLAIQVVHAIWANDDEQELVITSVNDSKHSAASRHWMGQAIDIRVRDPISGEWIKNPKEKVQAIRGCLTNDYDVIDEMDGAGPHIHIQYKPLR